MENSKKKSFALGYSFIGHSFLSYMFLAFVLVAVSNNVLPSFYDLVPENFANAMGGADKAMLLVNTLCAIFSAICGIFFGQWVDRKGPKQVLVIGYIIGGINYIVFPFAHSAGFGLLVVCLALTHTSMLAYCQMTTQSLVAHWFNKKKGFALGFSAVGIPAGNAVFSLVYSSIVSSLTVNGDDTLGVRIGLWVFGIALVVMGIVSVFWVKNTPAEVGLTPDNLPIDNEMGSVENRSYSFAEVARTPKVWIAIIIYGLLNCSVIACVAQMVPYIMERGNVSQETAVPIMSIGALGGIAGGFIISFMDQKLGTKKTTIIYCIAGIIVYGLMGILNTGSMVVVVILCMLAFALNGAPGPLLPSMIMTVFGPESFNSVSKIATPIACICRSCGYYVVALLTFNIGGMDSWSGVYVGLAIMVAVALVFVATLNTKHTDIKTRSESGDIFSMGEVYFGFNTNFQADVRKIKELLYGRGNTGIYVQGIIPQSDIEEIVEAGTYMPDRIGVNPVFVAVSDPETLRSLRGKMHSGVVPFAAKLRERFPGHPELKKDTEEFLASLDSAPLVVMAFTDRPIEGNALAEEVKQIGSAFQNMLLKAYGKGIGSYWLTSPIAAGAAPNLKAEFAPEAGEFIGMVTFGYYDKDNGTNTVKKGSVKYVK